MDPELEEARERETNPGSEAEPVPSSNQVLQLPRYHHKGDHHDQGDHSVVGEEAPDASSSGKRVRGSERSTYHWLSFKSSITERTEVLYSVRNPQESTPRKTVATEKLDIVTTASRYAPNRTPKAARQF